MVTRPSKLLPCHRYYPHQRSPRPPPATSSAAGRLPPLSVGTRPSVGTTQWRLRERPTGRPISAVLSTGGLWFRCSRVLGRDDHQRGRPRVRIRVAQRVTHLAPEVHQPADGPYVPPPDEHTPHTTRPARRQGMELVEEISIRRQGAEVGVDAMEREAPIGDDLIEMRHEVALRHDGQLAKPILIDGIDVDGRQPVSMPRRVCARHPEQLTEAQVAFGEQSIRGPGEAIEMLGEPRGHVLDMASASALVVPQRNLSKWGR